METYQLILQKYKKSIKKYYDPLYASKFNNLEEMDKFLETYSPLRLKQEEIDNFNRQITRSEIECIIYKFSINKSSGPDGFKGEVYQTYKEELLPILLKLFQKFEEEGILLKTFYEATITLIQNQTKRPPKKHYRPRSLMNIDVKILNKILTN